MRWRGEARHVYADLGDNDVGADRTQARHRAQQFGGLSKRLEPTAHLLFDGGDGLVQHIDVGQMQLEHEAVVSTDATTQGFEQFSAAGLDTADMAEQLLRFSLAVDEGLQYRAAALAQNVTDHDAELDVGVFEDLLDALGMGAALTHELLAGAGQRAQFLDRSRGHEAGTDQAMGQQIGQPHRVVDIGLAAGDVLDVCGVGQHQFEVPFEHVPHRLPVHARGLHGDVLDTERLEPVGQGQQPRCGRLEGANLLQRGAAAGNAYARHDGLLVHVQARAARVDDIHDRLHVAATSACGPRHRTLKCVLRGARPQATVRGARGAAGPTEIRVRGTKYKPTSVPDAAALFDARFMRRGSREARWSN